MGYFLTIQTNYEVGKNKKHKARNSMEMQQRNERLD